MTSHVARLYALALSLLVFFVAWAVVAARPWAAAKPDPRLAALAAREQRLQRESAVVKRRLERRWQAYRIAFAVRNAQIAARKRQAAAAPPPVAAPAVRIVTLPALTVTRTS